jgi:hypothetical protein
LASGQPATAPADLPGSHPCRATTRIPRSADPHQVAEQIGVSTGTMPYGINAGRLAAARLAAARPVQLAAFVGWHDIRGAPLVVISYWVMTMPSYRAIDRQETNSYFLGKVARGWGT